ncbi:MAG TPA: hypothetical protein VH592_15885 [Gemmataceae bacterium]
MRSTIVEYVNYLLSLLLALLPWALWCVFWLFAVNWRKAWPMLAAGGWAPALLLLVMASMAWAMIDARPCNWLGSLVVPNGWWQLGFLSTLAALAFVCGWLQGYFAWTPPEISTEPPLETHDHHDAHAHH